MKGKIVKQSESKSIKPFDSILEKMEYLLKILKYGRN